MITALPYTGERPGSELPKGASASRILVMGPAARAIAGALVRMQGTAEIHHAETAREAIDLLSASRFDHVLVDNRAVLNAALGFAPSASVPLCCL